MLRIHKAYQKVIREKIREGRIEGAVLGRENFVDIIIKKMKELGVIEDLKLMVADKRADNAQIPLELIWALGIDAKMKVKTSMTDIPYAIVNNERFVHPFWSERAKTNKKAKNNNRLSIALYEAIEKVL
jgi:hypothetical protein